MSKRVNNLNKLYNMYNELYSLEDNELQFDKYFGDDALKVIYKNNLTDKHLNVIEPFYQYKIKQRILGTEAKVDIYIAFDEDNIPYIVVYLKGYDFAIPENWRNITIPALPLYDRGKLHIKYVDNICINNKTQTGYDNTYNFIDGIITENIIVTKLVYIKVIKKVVSELEDKSKTRSLSIMDSVKRDTIDEFILRYIHKYMSKYEENIYIKERLDRYKKFLALHPDIRYRLETMKFVISIETNNIGR